MDELFFKKAEKKDAAILAEYRFRMFDEIYQDDSLAERKAEFIDECTRYYLDDKNKKDHYSIIAFIGKVAVGCGTVMIEERPPKPGYKTNISAHILNIYVDTGYRGKGIGKKIIEKLHEYAKSAGVRKIGLHASQFGRGLYKKIGYKIKEPYLEMEI